MGEKELFTVSKVVDKNCKEKQDLKPTVDLEEALDIVGVGRYNLGFCVLYAGFLIAVILETAGLSYVLPSARCDLGMSDQIRGFICAIPYVGVVLTSHLWGYAADTRGRRPVLIFTAFVSGTVGAAAAFMPDLATFAATKFVASLFLASPASISYSMIGETTPARYRDLIISVINSSQIMGSSAIPLLAWLISRLDFRVDFGLYHYRPWRLFSVIYSLSIVLCGTIMLLAPESPKFLLTKGREDEALKVLSRMYAANTGKRPEDFPVGAIRRPSVDLQNDGKQSPWSSMKQQTLPLFRAPYLKWMLLNSFLLFGVFATLNGLFLWVPDVINRVLSGSARPDVTVCEVIAARLNTTLTTPAVCDDYIATSTFQINSISNTVAALTSLLVGLSVKFIGKKTVLITLFLLVGAACIATDHITNVTLFAVLLSSLQLSAICIGCINAFSVAFFPTQLRGMAIGLSIMFGRMGSVLGTTLAGVLINASCPSTFLFFGCLLLLCGFLSFLLPSSQQQKSL